MRSAKSSLLRPRASVQCNHPGGEVAMAGGRYAHRSRGTIFGSRALRQMMDASIAIVCLLLLAFGGMAAVDLPTSGEVPSGVSPAVSSSPPDRTVYAQEGVPARS